MASIISAGTTSATALNMSADTTGILQLASNNGTVALTISTSQNIGIGTSSPVGTLNVIGGLGVGVALTGDQAVTPPSGSLVLSGTNLATEQTYTSPGASTTIGQIYNYASIANSYYRYLDLVAYGSTTGAGANIRFITGVGGGSTNVERMRISASGDVIIGATSTQAPYSGKALTVAGPVNFNGMNTTGTIANGGTSNLITFTSSQQGTYLFAVRQAGQSNGGIIGFTVVAVGSSSLSTTNLISSAVALSASTLTVVLTNNAGGSSAFQWSYTQIM